MHSLALTCDGVIESGRTASCNEDLPTRTWDSVPPTPDKEQCEDGDVMLVSDGTLYGDGSDEEIRENMWGAVGSPHILFEGAWAPICRTDANNHLATTFCQKLGLGFGIRSQTMKSKPDMDPALYLGECGEGVDLLNCSGHDVRAFLGGCVSQTARTPLIITCEKAFTGTATSCRNYTAFPKSKDRLAALNAARDRGNNTQQRRCPPNTEDFHNRSLERGSTFPHGMLAASCPAEGGPVMQTTCETIASRGVYRRIVQRVVAMYESLDDGCDEVCCPQADLAACILRFAGHDFMDFDQATFVGGSDACIDFTDIDNRGLFPCLAGDGEFSQGLTIEQVYAEFCGEVSLADFVVVMSEALMMRSRDDWDSETYSSPTLDFEPQFRFGRVTAATCSPKPLPNPERSCVAVEENFIDELGLTWTDAAAMMGVHTLGRASKNNSGYDGWWNEGPEGRSFNNSYYVSLLAKGWMPKNMGLGKNQWIRSDAGSELEFMLDTDLCLLYETENKEVVINGRRTRRSTSAKPTPTDAITGRSKRTSMHRCSKKLLESDPSDHAIGLAWQMLEREDGWMCPAFASMDWSSTDVVEGRRCAKVLAGIGGKGVSRAQAQRHCEANIKCHGLMWHSGAGGDGRIAAKGYYQGCGGSLTKMWVSKRQQLVACSLYPLRPRSNKLIPACVVTSTSFSMSIWLNCLAVTFVHSQQVCAS